MAEFFPPILDSTRSYELETIRSTSIHFEYDNICKNVFNRITLTLPFGQTLINHILSNCLILAFRDIDNHDTTEYSKYESVFSIGLSEPICLQTLLPSTLVNSICKESDSQEVHFVPSIAIMLVWNLTDDELQISRPLGDNDLSTTPIYFISVYCLNKTRLCSEFNCSSRTVVTPTIQLQIPRSDEFNQHFDSIKVLVYAITKLEVISKVLSSYSREEFYLLATSESTFSWHTKAKIIQSLILFELFHYNYGHNLNAAITMAAISMSPLPSDCHVSPSLSMMVGMIRFSTDQMRLESLLSQIFLLHCKSDQEKLTNGQIHDCPIMTTCPFELNRLQDKTLKRIKAREFLNRMVDSYVTNEFNELTRLLNQIYVR